MTSVSISPGRTRVNEWFARKGWSPFPFQERTWDAFDAGHDGLLHAPTGMGKTWAVFGGPVADWMTAHPNAAVSPPESRPSRFAPATILWITPLRALAADSAANLQAIAQELGIPWRIEVRSGDTSAATKTRQRKSLPTVLITTPESLSILLSYPGAGERFGTLTSIVVDEWHELLASKRGVQTELCLARLRAIVPDARIWGVSATLGNLDEAMSALLGPDRASNGVRVDGDLPKRIDVETLRPEDIERFPWAGHLGLRLLPKVIECIESARSTLIFTNTRSQSEIWFQEILRSRPDLTEAVALHHGSLDRAHRDRVEAMLKAGELRAVVCTSSLDLGVDFSPVEQVLQIGSPKGVARLMQRAGRSGHQPGAVSRLIGVPTNALELVEFSAARGAVMEGRIESRPPIRRAMDVLVQHLVTLAVGDGFDADTMRDEVRSTHAFQDIDAESWAWAIDFVTRGGSCLTAYPQFHKVVPTDDGMKVASPQIAKLHRMSIGTITGDGSVSVRYRNGRSLGTIEESFIARIRPGDRFVFSGKIVELIRVRAMTATVRPSKTKRGVVPRWNGGRTPLSTQLSDAVRMRLDAARRGEFPDEEMKFVAPILDVQAAWSMIPAKGDLLIERTTVGRLHHTFVFTFAGRLVNEGLCMLAAHRISADVPSTINLSHNDYGFEVVCDQRLPTEADDWRRWLSEDALLDDLLGAMNAGEMSRRHFREIAPRGRTHFSGLPGAVEERAATSGIQ